MAAGKVIKSLSGFYDVRTEDGAIYRCRGRGIFRKRKITPLVGDWVVFEAKNNTDGYILEIGERKNELARPPIANVDQALLVFSLKEPDLNLRLVDKFLVHIEAHAVAPFICFTKTDLLRPEERQNAFEKANLYRSIGYSVLFVSAVQDDGIRDILSLFQGKVTVVAGQSGVGKSSLLNALEPSLQIETGEISAHLGRGKHTTRHVELLPLAGGLVADTPGFSSLDFDYLEEKDLSLYFPEMRRLLPDCKFRGCTHLAEPGCAVKKARDEGTLSESRYNHYKTFYHEIKQKKRRY